MKQSPKNSGNILYIYSSKAAYFSDVFRLLEINNWPQYLSAPLLLPDIAGAPVPIPVSPSAPASTSSKTPVQTPSTTSPSSAQKQPEPKTDTTSKQPSPAPADGKPAPPTSLLSKVEKLVRRLIALAAIVVPTAVTAEMLFLPTVRQHQTKGKVSPTGNNHLMPIIDVLLSVHILVIPGVAIAIGFLTMAILEQLVSLMLSGLVGGGVAAGLIYFVTQQYKGRALALDRHIKLE
jgi:hypothetical protein